MGRRTSVQPSEFAEHFRRLVLSTGLPLDRLAARVGRSATTLSRYQTGQGLPDHAVLAAVHRESSDPPLPLPDYVVLLDIERGLHPGLSDGPKRRRWPWAVVAVVLFAGVGFVAAAVMWTFSGAPVPERASLRVCADDRVDAQWLCRPSN